MTDNQRGAMLMMGSMAAFTVNDTFIKLLGGVLPLGQILFLRGGFVLIVWPFWHGGLGQYGGGFRVLIGE